MHCATLSMGQSSRRQSNAWLTLTAKDANLRILVMGFVIDCTYRLGLFEHCDSLHHVHWHIPTHFLSFVGLSFLSMFQSGISSSLGCIDWQQAYSMMMFSCKCRSGPLFGHSLLWDILRIFAAGAKCVGHLEQKISKRRRAFEDPSLVGWICSGGGT